MKKQSQLMLNVEDITVSVTNLVLVNHVSFDVKQNDRLMIVGPNGAGKSTLINAISQGMPYTGKVCYDGADMSLMKPKEIAQKIGFLSQRNDVNYSFTVEEIVGLGRYAYSTDLFSKASDDKQYIEEALEMTGLINKRHQSVSTLSGGEVQRTFLAQVLAQDPDLLILDEPTNHLDIQYQTQIFTLIDKWVSSKNRAFVAVVHDLSLASYFGNKFLLLDKGDVVAYGSKDDVLSTTNLDKTYQIDVYQWMQTLYKQWKFS
jgi:iron complex transport system ATP-binding protein